MYLANGEKNIFFNKNVGYNNKYNMDSFDVYNNRATSNVYLLTKQIKENSKVLDIACGQGIMSLGLKNKNCELYGLDGDLKALTKAKEKGYYKNLFLGDINAEKFGLSEEHYISVSSCDVIILSDILEHLEEPTNLILKSIDLLKEDGEILISVPNIANSDIVINLIDGKFNYTDMGILDNTHLKFFTKNSFFQWIDLINLEYGLRLNCQYLGSTFYESPTIKNIKKKYPDLYSILSLYEENNSLQILFKISLEGTVKDKIEEKNVSDILGEAIEKNIVNSDLSTNKGIGEQLYIDQQETYISQQSERILELEKGIDWHNENKEKQNVYISQQNERILELEKGIDWHNENKEKQNVYISQQNERILELEKGIDWHNENEENSKIYIDGLMMHIQSSDEEIAHLKIKYNEANKELFELKESKLYKLFKGWWNK